MKSILSDHTKDLIEGMLEKKLPLIVSLLICGIFILFSDLTLSNINNIKEILAAIINIAAVIIGFLLTMVSILISLTGKKVIKRIQDNNAIGIFTSYFTSPIALGFFLIILCTSLMPFDTLSGKWSHLLVALLLFISLYFLTATIRISILLLGVLNKMSSEFEKPSSNKKKVETYIPDSTNLFKKN